MKKLFFLLSMLGCSAAAFAAGHTVTITTVNVTCFGACDGSATSVVSGGVGPFTYSWAPSGGTGAAASGLCAGTYTVTVTDNSDMSTATTTATITSPSALSVSISGSGMVCSGGCTNLTATASGGTPMYTYNWTPGSVTTAVHTVCPGTATTYTVTVVDINGCVATTTTMVSVVTPTVTVPPTYSVCPGGCVMMTATASGGAAYSWSPPTGLSSTTTSNPTACVAATTTYTVTATFAGCTATATTTVTVGGAITSGINSTNTSGCVICDGTASVAPVGGAAPYIYSWATGATTPAISSLCAGTYSVVITDAAGCSTTDSTTVFANNDAIANFTMVPDSTNPYNFFAFNSSIGTGNLYDWSWGDGSPNSTSANPSHTWGSTGVMTVCLTASNFLCGADTLCQTVNVTGILDPCNALFNIADDTLNPDPNAHYVYNLSYGATLSYLWDFGDGTTSTSMTPSHVYSGTGPYLLCLTVDNGMGCTDMYCDSLISADSLNRDGGIMQLTVVDLPTYYSTATGVEETANATSVSVAPNPFSQATVFTVKTAGPYSFELTDVLGKKVKEISGISESQFEISRGELRNGIYFYRIYAPDSVLGTGKVVIR